MGNRRLRSSSLNFLFGCSKYLTRDAFCHCGTHSFPVIKLQIEITETSPTIERLMAIGFKSECMPSCARSMSVRQCRLRLAAGQAGLTAWYHRVGFGL